MHSRPMRDIDQLLASPTSSARDALAIIDSQDEKIALITDADRRLLGVVTDGDIRRHLLKGGDLRAPVTSVMNRSPVVARADWDQHSILVLMRARSLRQVPVVDSSFRVRGIFVGAERVISTRIDTPVLIMAGGFGTRLAPLTDSVPKPMLEIGGQPMLEIIIKRLILQGFGRFYLSVHYLPEVIMSYFGNGAPWGCSIQYLVEQTPLGTGGAISLLPSEETASEILVTNGDVLTTLDHADMLEFHLEQKADMTVCTRTHEIEVPFGVISQTNNVVRKIVEKPTHQILVNTGVYVLGSQARSRVPPNTPLPITDLIARLIREKRRVCSFSTSADWTDVGRHDDLRRVRKRAEEAASLGWIDTDAEFDRVQAKERAEVRTLQTAPV